MSPSTTAIHHDRDYQTYQMMLKLFQSTDFIRNPSTSTIEATVQIPSAYKLLSGGGEAFWKDITIPILEGGILLSASYPSSGTAITSRAASSDSIVEKKYVSGEDRRKMVVSKTSSTTWTVRSQKLTDFNGTYNGYIRAYAIALYDPEDEWDVVTAVNYNQTISNNTNITDSSDDDDDVVRENEEKIIVSASLPNSTNEDYIPRYAVVGGGGSDKYQDFGNILVGSWPSNEMDSNDYDNNNRRSLASMLKINKDVVTTSQSRVLSGGTAGNFASEKSLQELLYSWNAKGNGNKIDLAAYVIGLRHKTTGYIPQCTVKTKTSTKERFPTATLSADAGWTVVGGGAVMKHDQSFLSQSGVTALIPEPVSPEKMSEGVRFVARAKNLRWNASEDVSVYIIQCSHAMYLG